MRLRILAFAMALLALSLPAHTHSELRASTPVNGEKLTSSPSIIDLRFNEKVQVTAVRLYDPDSKEVAVVRDRSLQEKAVYTAQPPALAPGPYRIEWRAISADGHPVGGTIRFIIGN